MNTDEYAGDRSSLVKRINEAIISVRNNAYANDPNIKYLIKIAEITKKHVLSTENNTAYNGIFFQDLLSIDKNIKVQHSSRAWKINRRETVNPLGIASNPELTYTNDGGKPLLLGKCLGRGGEGSVYKIPSCPGKVAKIYSEELLQSDTISKIEEKISYLIKRRDAAYIGETLIAAFPEEILLSPSGKFAGYIMPQFATSIKLVDVQREGQRRKLFPDLDYRGLIAIAYNLAEAVDHLHRHGIIIGDLNQNNILVHSDGTIGLIDCNSFDLNDPETGNHYPCPVGLQELLAPELQTVGKLSNATFTEESDCFSLAIHIFRLLMNNADPFGCMDYDDQNSMKSATEDGSANAIVRGECVYVRSIPGKTIPFWAPSLSILPKDIQTLFQRTFSYTADTIMARASQRATASEWMESLNRFFHAPLTRCHQDGFHLYLPSLPKCPFCQKYRK